MSLYFTKMHGLGNDFMVIDAIRQEVKLSAADIIALAKRDTGIGFDQCLIIEPSLDDTIDFFYRIFNANGQEVGQCGNGARCLMRFIHHYQLSNKTTINVATKTTRMQLQLNQDDSVTIDFGKPKQQPRDIPLHAKTIATYYELPLADGSIYPIHALSVGNPHAVSLVTHLATTPIDSLGPQISQHPCFPEQTNAGFMEIINPQQLLLRVYERGCGETRACGSGAVAAAAIGRLYYGMDANIQVILPGGSLQVEWPDINGSIYLSGPAVFIYEGQLL